MRWGDLLDEGAIFSVLNFAPRRFYFSRGRHSQGAILFCDTGPIVTNGDTYDVIFADFSKYRIHNFQFSDLN